jgi:hypothetical protein
VAGWQTKKPDATGMGLHVALLSVCARLVLIGLEIERVWWVGHALHSQ